MRAWLSVRTSLVGLGVGLSLLRVGPAAISPSPASAAPVESVALNEIYAKPCAGAPVNQAFVELYNRSEETISIGGWLLGTDSSGSYTFPAGRTIAPGEYLVVLWRTDTGFDLDDDGDRVYLFDGVTDQAYHYPSTACGLAFGRVPDGEGPWSEDLAPSPGARNVRASPTPSDTPSAVPTPTVTPSRTPSRTPTATPRPTRTATASPTPTSTATPTPLVPCSVCLSEFLPAPGSVIDWDGDGQRNSYDEWIELHNALDRTLDVGGWMLDDAADSGSYRYIIPEGTLLAAGEYRVFFRRETKLVLNNTGDTVLLLAPDGALVDEARYSPTQYDVALSRRNACLGPWWMNWNPTPGEPNVLLPCKPPCTDGWRTDLPLIRR